MLELNESNFEEATSQGLVVVDFYADWCAPCRALSPILEQITGIQVAKVDVVANQSLAAKFGVDSIPRLIFMKDGEVKTTLSGLQTKATIQSKVDELKA